MHSDWEVKKCIRLSVAILLSLVGLVELTYLGYDIPGLRQIIGFIFLTFVPGMLILRILKIHNLSMVKTIVYSSGLSLTFLMFTGLFVNTVFPPLGISRPISTIPIMVMLVIFTIILCIGAYMRDRHFRTSGIVDDRINATQWSPSLFLFLLPLLAIIGALMVTARSDNNILLLILLSLIALIPALIAFTRFIPSQIYPLAIIAISVALVYHFTLINPELTGSDIHVEFYYQWLVIENSYLNITAPLHPINSMLSIVILSPIYSLVLGMDSVWVFKIIYPLIFSLVPLSLFEIYRMQMNDKKAFLSVFFFMSFFVFFTEMMSLARQQIAELFLVLLILIMLDINIASIHKRILAVIFTLSISLSHYGLAYISVAILAIGSLLFVLIKSKTYKNLLETLPIRFNNSSPNVSVLNSISRLSCTSMLTSNIALILLVFTISWYIYTSSGSSFNSIVQIGSHLSRNIGEFFNPTARESLTGTAFGRDFTSVSTLGKVFRFEQYLIQIFIVAGLIKLIVKPQDFRFRAEYIALSLVGALILLASIVLPFFSGYLNVTRFYQIALIFLSPFFILGYEALWQWAVKAAKSVSIHLRAKQMDKMPIAISNPAIGMVNLSNSVLVLVLITYFLFNTGFVFEITEHKVMGEIPSSIPLSSYRIDGDFYNKQDGVGAIWLSRAIDAKPKIYADRHFILMDRILYTQLSDFPIDAYTGLIGLMPKNSYIFFRSRNMKESKITIWDARISITRMKEVAFEDLPKLFSIINNKGKIYDNGGVQIFR